jgi:Putative peptidoglycan binding domain
MRSIKVFLVGPVLAGILALAPTAAFAHGGGGNGHGGRGGHFGGGHFTGFAGHSFAGHSFAQHQGTHFARHFGHEGHFFYGGPIWYDYPFYGYDYPYYGYYDDNAADYSNGQSLAAEGTSSQGTIIAVQQKLTQLGYYHGQVDGLIGPQTEGAIRWFQSVDKLPVTGQIDDSTLKAMQIS